MMESDGLPRRPKRSLRPTTQGPETQNERAKVGYALTVVIFPRDVKGILGLSEKSNYIEF
jgi:hypothetical protein